MSASAGAGETTPSARSRLDATRTAPGRDATSRHPPPAPSPRGSTNATASRQPHGEEEEAAFMRQPPNAAARSLAIPPGTAAVTCKVPEPFPRSSGPREASCRIYGRRPAALYSPLRESTLSAIPPPSDKPQRQYRLRSIRPKRARLARANCACSATRLSCRAKCRPAEGRTDRQMGHGRDDA